MAESAKSSFKIFYVDLTHPYYIHHSDQPRATYIFQVKARRMVDSGAEDTMEVGEGIFTFLGLF